MSGCELATLSEPVFSNVIRMPLLIPRRRTSRAISRRRTHRAICRADMAPVAIEHYLVPIVRPAAPWGQDAEKRRSKLGRTIQLMIIHFMNA